VQYVALIEAAAIVVIVAVFAALLRWQQRAYTRERHLLVNQLLHATGRTWQPPPVAEPADDADERELVMAAPEQWPVWE
jgi:hypothetical protein